MCSGSTGHAEVVEVIYDPDLITVEDLLGIWLNLHDPTMDARHYRGGQYRSAVYYTTPEQERVIKRVMEQIAPQVKRSIVTEIAAAPKFWPAEDYHQRYYEKNRIRACSR